MLNFLQCKRYDECHNRTLTLICSKPRTSWSVHFHPLWCLFEPCPPPSCWHALLKPQNHVVPSISIIMSFQEWQINESYSIFWGWAFTQHNFLVIYQGFLCMYVTYYIFDIKSRSSLPTLILKIFSSIFWSKVLCFTWESLINTELVFVQSMQFRLWFILFYWMNIFIFRLWKVMASAPHEEQVVLPLLNCF